MDELVLKLAAAFSRAIREALTPDQLAAVRALNAAEGPVSPVCHTHDHIDANDAMIAAFRQVTGRDPDPSARADADLINAAWCRAKMHHFSA